MRLRVVLETDPAGLVRLQSGGFAVSDVGIMRAAAEGVAAVRAEIAGQTGKEQPHAKAHEGDRQGGGLGAFNTGAPGPSPAEAAGPLPQALPPSPRTVATPAAVDGEPPVATAPPAVALPLTWKSPEREARLRQLWAEPAYSISAIYRALAALPGLAMPSAPTNIYQWAHKLDLGPRPFKPEVPADPAPAPAPDPEDAPVDPLPAGEIRETPQLKRARELLAMGMHINGIRPAVKLTASEWDLVKAEAAGS